MKIVVIGTGYVGLVTGACFAEKGNGVWCVDIDETRINKLKANVVPIYEQGLEELVQRNSKAGRLRFSTDIRDGLKDAEACFIAVGTPPKINGETDMTQVLSVAASIGDYLDHPCVIVTKSTVPVGTGNLLRGLIGSRLRERGLRFEVEIASNPEFLKEGVAIGDCLCPERVIIGVSSDKARGVMERLYRSYTDEGKMIFMDLASAEITKYAANAMLAARISFINEIALLCDAVGADVKSVKAGIASDSRIGGAFLNAGCGYGGSCFPKDVTSLCATGEAYGVTMSLAAAIDKVNRAQKRLLPTMLRERFGSGIAGKKITVLGLAFKPQTDDMREAPSIELIKMLTEFRAQVTAYDPIAAGSAATVLPLEVVYARSAEEALKDADAAVLVTEWPEFGDIDWPKAGEGMRSKILLDGRNFYEPSYMRDIGFEYHCIGRRCACGAELKQEAGVQL